MKSWSIILRVFSCLILSSCNGLFQDIYDVQPQGNATDEGFSTAISDPCHMTLTLDASDFGVWNYISLKNKTIEKHAIPLACEGKWDGKSGITYQEVKGDENNWLSILNANEARGGLRGRGS